MKFNIHRRFFASLMLKELINEVPIYEISQKYDVARGFVQNLANSCKGFAHTTSTFCKKMGWVGLSVLLEHYIYRLDMGWYSGYMRRCSPRTVLTMLNTRSTRRSSGACKTSFCEKLHCQNHV